MNVFLPTVTHTETMAELAIMRTPDGGLVVVPFGDIAQDQPMRVEDVEATPTHRHYKGGIYSVIGHALHDGEELTIYRSRDKGGYWGRPRAMFEGRLDDGTIRFTPLG